MPGKSVRVLIAFADTSDLLLLRRILRETPYIPETARSATAALRAMCGHQYAAIITDDERLPGMPGAKLLAEASNVQPGALRVLLVRSERMAALETASRAGAYVTLPRPFFSPGLRAALLEHYKKQPDLGRIAAPAGPPRDSAGEPEPPARPRLQLRDTSGEPEPPPRPRAPIRDAAGGPLPRPRLQLRNSSDELPPPPPPPPRPRLQLRDSSEQPPPRPRVQPADSFGVPEPAPGPPPRPRVQHRDAEQAPRLRVVPGGDAEVEPEPTARRDPRRPPRLPLLDQDAPGPPLETRVFPALVEAETLPHELRGNAPVTRRRMLLTMVEMVEAKGGPSRGHGLRVSSLAAALGKEAGVRGPDLETLEEAALIHDIGELAVVAPLLQKNRRLTPAEQRQVHRHVESGAKIAHRGGMSRLVQLAVRHHHERWDGKGYPDGLSGSAIPLCSRIIAVADTWDALATRRPYRQRISTSECIKTLGLLGGAQLDPELVGLFLRRKLSEVCDWSEPETPGPSLLDPPWSSA